jgi:hypothetical protein
MRKFAIPFALAASCALAGTFTSPATAAPLGSHNLGSVAVEIGSTEQVHCRPGRWHHRNGPADGCYRERRGYYYYDDGPYYRDRYYYRSPGVGVYGPGVGLYFGY